MFLENIVSRQRHNVSKEQHGGRAGHSQSVLRAGYSQAVNTLIARRVHRLAVAQLTNPLFQNHLVIWLDPRKDNSHVTVSRGIGHLAESRKRTAFARNSHFQFGSSGKGLASAHAAAIQTQIGDTLLRRGRALPSSLPARLGQAG